ncbi:hypothetical protein [Marinicella sp. W31]|uniref:hypothetical protein n=1 Tax=Marinicella sp. W31 TaxID=3023713 RepID=UPI003757B642
MLKKLTLVAALAAGMQVQAADDINYSWFELGVQHSDVNSVEWQSIYLEGSVAFSDSFYFTGGYRDQVSGDDTDLSIFNIGLGFHTGITAATDFYTELGGGRFDAVLGDDNYYGLKIGTRSEINESFEFISGLEYQDVDDGGERFVLELGGLFKLDNGGAIKVAFEGDDDDFLGLEVGYRWNF